MSDSEGSWFFDRCRSPASPTPLRRGHTSPLFSVVPDHNEPRNLSRAPSNPITPLASPVPPELPAQRPCKSPLSFFDRIASSSTPSLARCTSPTPGTSHFARKKNPSTISVPEQQRSASTRASTSHLSSISLDKQPLQPHAQQKSQPQLNQQVNQPQEQHVQLSQGRSRESAPSSSQRHKDDVGDKNVERARKLPSNSAANTSNTCVTSASISVVHKTRAEKQRAVARKMMMATDTMDTKKVSRASSFSSSSFMFVVMLMSLVLLTLS